MKKINYYSWEQRKLGEIGKTFTGLSGKTANDFGHGKAKFLPYLNIFNNPIADADFLEMTEIDLSQNQIQYGDVFFTTSSETPEEVGMSSIWLGKGDNIYLNSFCFGFRPSITIDPYYLGYYLRSNSFRKKITVLAQGISRFNISKTKVLDLSICLPSLEEQRLIGMCFKNLDQSITLHQRKCEILSNFKKALLSKMFPENGSNVPSIRFKGFTDPWEQRKLGEIGKCFSGFGFPENEQGGTIGLPFYKVSDMNLFNNAYELKDCSNFVTLKQIIRHHWKPVFSPSIFFAKVGAAVLLNRKRLVLHRFLLDNNTMAFNFDSKRNDPYFIYSVFQNINLPSLVQVGALPSYNGSQVENIDVSLPKLLEEEKVGLLFLKLDRLITLHQRESL